MPMVFTYNKAPVPKPTIIRAAKPSIVRAAKPSIVRAAKPSIVRAAIKAPVNRMHTIMRKPAGSCSSCG